MNSSISEEKKQQLVNMLKGFERESEGVFDDFEESILCIQYDDMQIIHPVDNKSLNQQNPQQPVQKYSGNQQYPQNQNIQGQGAQYHSNQQLGQRGQPGQYPQQLGRNQIGSGQYMGQQGQQISQLPKPQSSQSYNGGVAELSPEQKRAYLFKFQLELFKRYIMNIPQNDPQHQIYRQKYQNFLDRQLIDDEDKKRVFDYKQFLQNQFKLFDENMKNCQDPSRREQLQMKLKQLAQKLNQDQTLYLFYMDELFQGTDRKIITCEDQSCSQYFKLLSEFFKTSQNLQMQNMFDSLFKSKEIRGYEQFHKIIKEKNIEYLLKALEDRNRIINQIYKIVSQELPNYFNKQQFDINQKKALQKSFFEFLQKKHAQFQYRETILYSDIAKDSECPDNQLMNNILNNKEFISLLNVLTQTYKQSQEIMSFQRNPPRQQYSSQNPNAGLNASNGSGYQQINQSRSDESSRQIQQRQPGYSSQQPLIPPNQPQSEPQHLGGVSNLNQNLSSSQQLQQQNIPPQSNIFSRNMSEQQYKQEDEKKSSINYPSNQQTQGGSSSQQKIPGGNFQDETAQFVTSSQIKQEGAQQQIQSVKQISSSIAPYQLNSSSSAGQSQVGGMMNSQLVKAKAKRLLGDDNLIKKINYFCDQNNVEPPSQSELQNILSYINEVFKTYMKNLIERLLQSSIVENIDNEFSLFCPEKLEQHFVPFRGQSIEKYLLNKADPSGAREKMTFLKYYKVQSDNKIIRRNILEKNDEDIEQTCYEQIQKHSLFDKSIMKYDLDKTQHKGCSASEEIKSNILRMPPAKSKGAKKDLKQELMPQSNSLATTNCQRQKITLKNIQLYLEADPIYRKSAILLKAYLC